MCSWLHDYLNPLYTIDAPQRSSIERPTDADQTACKHAAFTLGPESISPAPLIPRPLFFRIRLCTTQGPYNSICTTEAHMDKAMGLFPPKRIRKMAECAFLAGFALLARVSLRAQSATTVAPANAPTAPEVPVYSAHRGHWVFGAQLGYTMEYGLDQHEVSHIQMLIAQPQLGFIVRDFRTSLVRRFEIIDEGILGGAVHPHTAYLAGNAVIFRLDGNPHGRWVPFFDAGAGVQHTPLRDHVPEVNGFTQFTPQGGVGLQYFIRPQRAVVFEWRTIHMSNADLVPPNMGFNSSMLTIGFRWLRRPG
jgi:hypothetical protein